MLRGIRTASGNWLGKIVLWAVMGVLIVSFAVWGIGDIFRGFGLSTVARVGNTEISVEQFRREYTDRLQQLSRRINKPLTNEQARLLGLDRQIIDELLSEAALDERARQLRLGLSDAEVARQITNDPAFKGPNGFDRVRFEQLIRQAGFTEARFVAEQRRTGLRRQLVQSVIAGVEAPNATKELVHRYTNELRSVDYMVLTREQAGEIPPPSPEQVEKYFADNKAAFRAPEFRKVAILTLRPEDIAASVQVSDEDVKRAYEQRRDNLELLGAKRSFEDTAAEIRATLANDRARALVTERQDKIEDERAAGSRLTEVGQKLGIPVRTIETDRTGRAPDGSEIEGLPIPTLVNSAFGTDVHVETDPLQIPGGGSAWYEVEAIIPARDRTLGEIRERVETRYRDEQAAEILQKRAAEIVQTVLKGGTLRDIEGLEVQNAAQLKRGGEAKLPPRTVSEIFRAPKGTPAIAEGQNPAERIVFVVTDITTAPLTAGSPEAERIGQTLARSYTEDLLAQYITQLRKDLGSNINPEAFRRVVGGTS